MIGLIPSIVEAIALPLNGDLLFEMSNSLGFVNQRLLVKINGSVK